LACHEIDYFSDLCPLYRNMAVSARIRNEGHACWRAADHLAPSFLRQREIVAAENVQIPHGAAAIRQACFPPQCEKIITAPACWVV